MAQNKELIPFNEIQERIDKLKIIQTEYKYSADKLREALSHS